MHSALHPFILKLDKEWILSISLTIYCSSCTSRAVRDKRLNCPQSGRADLSGVILETPEWWNGTDWRRSSMSFHPRFFRNQNVQWFSESRRYGRMRSEVEQLYSTRHCGVVKTDTQHQASLAELRTLAQGKARQVSVFRLHSTCIATFSAQLASPTYIF